MLYMDKTNENANENLDSINEETVEEETIDEEESSEGDEPVEDETESTTDDDDEAKQQRRESTIDRLKKERDEAKSKLAEYESKKEEKKNSKVDDALLARLENRGVMESEDQEYVIKFAKVEGISPIDALQDSVVQDRLTRFKKDREQKESTVSSNNRTGQKSNEVDRWVKKYKRDGSLPDNNPSLTSKILDKLKTE